MEPTPLSRALERAPERPVADAVKPEQEFFLFRLGKLFLGVASVNVREVTRLGALTPLPRMAAFVLGVAGHRGEVLPVVDLLRFFGQGESRVGVRSRAFVGISGSHTAACIADEVVGLRKLLLADVWAPPVGGDIPVEHLLGVVAAPNGETLHLLNLPRVMHAARQKVVAR